MDRVRNALSREDYDMGLLEKVKIIPNFVGLVKSLSI